MKVVMIRATECGKTGMKIIIHMLYSLYADVWRKHSVELVSQLLSVYHQGICIFSFILGVNQV